MIITNLAAKKNDNVPTPAAYTPKIIPQIDRGDKVERDTRAPRKPYVKESYSHHSCQDLCGRVTPCGNKACSNYRGKK